MTIEELLLEWKKDSEINKAKLDAIKNYLPPIIFLDISEKVKS